MDDVERDALRSLFLECFDRFVAAIDEKNKSLVGCQMIQFAFLLGGVRHHSGETTFTEDELIKVFHWMRYSVGLEDVPSDCSDQHAARMLLNRAWSWEQ